MDNFADFIIDYVENKNLHGIQGWFNQLKSYRWKNDSYPDMISITRKRWEESTKILNTPNNDDIWCRHCDNIRKWGRMSKVPPVTSKKFKSSVQFLIHNDPVIDSDLTKCLVSGTRIATASKIYYFSNPLKWTIYDSRVGYALHQLIFEYAKKQRIPPESVFPNNLFCLPESKTERRERIYFIGRCHESEQRSLKSFLWTSYLHRKIANKLNSTIIQKPEHFISDKPSWELPHVEMVFFMIGDSRWVDV